MPHGLAGLAYEETGVPALYAGAVTARHRLEHLYQRICTFVCFPGAFVTSVLPVYLALIFVAKLIMPD